LKQKVKIVCSATDVQDDSQPVLVTGQLKGSPSKMGNGSVDGSRIVATFSASKSGTYTVLIRGAGDGYVPWTSNKIKIKVK
jgi:hypothetical protein